MRTTSAGSPKESLRVALQRAGGTHSLETSVRNTSPSPVNGADGTPGRRRWPRRSPGRQPSRRLCYRVPECLWRERECSSFGADQLSPPEHIRKRRVRARSRIPWDGHAVCGSQRKRESRLHLCGCKHLSCRCVAKQMPVSGSQVRDALIIGYTHLMWYPTPDHMLVSS